MDIKGRSRSLLNLLISGPTKQVQKAACPACGKGLRLIYTSGEKHALSVQCLDRMCYGANLDGLVKPPDWVNDLGAKCITEPDR